MSSLHYSYRQLRRTVESLSETLRAEIIDLGMRHRGRHDELLRDFAAGQKFRFDILMDIGGYPRYASSPQVRADCLRLTRSLMDSIQPEEITLAGHAQRYAATMQRAAADAQQLAEIGAETAQIRST